MIYIYYDIYIYYIIHIKTGVSDPVSPNISLGEKSHAHLSGGWLEPIFHARQSQEVASISPGSCGKMMISLDGFPIR